jgi:exonuclease III
MRFVTWNVRSLYMAAARELRKYKLHLLGVQEVRWDRRGGTETFKRGKWLAMDIEGGQCRGNQSRLSGVSRWIM